MELKFFLLKKFYQLKYLLRPQKKYLSRPVPLSQIEYSGFPETYHLMIRIFKNGRLEEVSKNLEALAQAGIKQLWLSPLHTQSIYTNNDHGYWPDNHQNIDPLIGDEEDLKFLVSEARHWGINILMDAPINHVGYRANFRLNGKKIKVSDLDFFRVHREFGNKDKLLWVLLNDTKEQGKFLEITKIICQRPLFGLPTFVHENEELQKYFIRSYCKFIDYNITCFRIDAANVIPLQYQIKFINELMDYGNRSGKEVSFLLDLWLDDDPLFIFLDLLLPSLKKKNIFIDDTHFISTMRLTFFNYHSFAKLKELLKSRSQREKYLDYLVAFPESHDYKKVIHEEFDKLALYLISEFCCRHHLIFHHGKEDNTEAHKSNRDKKSTLRFDSQFFRYFLCARKAIAPFKIKKYSYELDENTDEHTLVLALGSHQLVLIIHLGDRFTYYSPPEKRIVPVVTHGNVTIENRNIIMAGKSLILMELV